MKKNYNSKLLLTLLVGLMTSVGWSQVTTFTYTGAAESYVVPAGVANIQIEVSGASGGDGDGGVGGLGATMIGSFVVTPGDVLEVVVGEAGIQYGNSGAGGAGSGVSFGGAPLIVAGGGGGGSIDAAGTGGVITEDGGSSSGAGGTAGNGGGKGFVSGDCGWASGGGGYYGDGFGGDGSWDGGAGTLSGTGAGFAWTAGGAGGVNGGCSFTYPNAGTWGCGGGGAGSYGGAGGGGYSGGGGGQYVDIIGEEGGAGGGSYNDGIDQVNTPNNHAGNGEVIITVLCDALIADISSTGVCEGEEVTMTVTSPGGGLITWDLGIDNGVPFVPPLGTTTYTATSDVGTDCNFSVDISSTVIPTITASASSPIACEGATVTCTGGGGDTYVWTGTGDVDPTDGVPFEAEEGVITYTVIGSVLGCEGPAADVVIEGAPQPNVVATATPTEICYGESVELTGSGASSYNWGGGITDGESIIPGSPGTYVYTLIGVSDVGCGDTTSATVIVHDIPVVDAGLDQTVCIDNDVTLTATGAVTYIWSDVAVENGVPFPVVEGSTTYSVSGSDENGCKDSDEVVVTGIGVPTVTGVVEDEYDLYGAAIDVTVTGGSGPYGYSWSHGPTTEDVTGLTEGTYTVVVDDIGVAEGICPDVEATFTVTSFIGIQELTGDAISIYPNPTTQDILVSFEGEFTYEITNINGDVLLRGIAVDQESISLKDVAAGTYLVNVMSNGVLTTAKVVKQ